MCSTETILHHAQTASHLMAFYVPAPLAQMCVRQLRICGMSDLYNELMPISNTCHFHSTVDQSQTQEVFRLEIQLWQENSHQI